MSPFALSNDLIEILAAAFIAVIIAAAIILIFNHMGNRAAIKKAQRGEARKSFASPARKNKKSDELTQDDLYGMVLGDDDTDKKTEVPARVDKKIKR